MFRTERELLRELLIVTCAPSLDPCSPKMGASVLYEITHALYNV